MIDQIQQEVIGAQQLFWTALKSKDRGLFEQILAEDFVARSPGRANQSRAELIATLTSFPAEVVAVGSDNLEVHIFGAAAVLTGVQSAQLRLPDGAIIVDTIALTNVFHKVAGQWRMALSHAVALPGVS